MLLTPQQRKELCWWRDQVNQELADLAACKVRPGTDVDFAQIEAEYLVCLDHIDSELLNDCAARLR